MNKYKTANGTIATEQELRDYYGVRFEEMLASGAFVKVEEGAELKKKVSPVLPMAPQQEQMPNAIPGVQPFTGSPSEDTSLDLQSSQSKPIPVRPTDVPVVNQQEDQTPFGVFNQKITSALTPEEQARSVKIQQPVVQEQPEEKVDADYFTGAFSDVLKGFDKISPIGIGDFIDDMARSVASGYRQGTAAQEADNLLLQGTKATPEQIQKFIDANKNAQLLGPSQEMVDYQKIYEEEGKGFWGVIKGLINNPSVIPEIISSSLVAMATNKDALTAGAVAIDVGAGIGAGIGAFGGGVAAIPGAFVGAAAAVPYAIGLASSVVEMGSTFGELLTEELNGKEMTKENVKAILENPEKLQSIRNKAIVRGAIIGTVDAFTGKLAGGVGAKIIGKSAAKSATGAVTKAAITKATAAGAAIESTLGSAGEAIARSAIGQEMNVSDIALEGIADLPGGIRSTLQARLAKPSYKVNGAKATAEQVDELINTMTPDQLQQTKIDIKNDYEGREFKIQDKIVTNSVKEQVKQGNPDLNEPSLNAITDLELQLRKLEGNTTQTGKDKAAAIRTQIKGIQENQIQEEAKVATIEAEAPEITIKRDDKIAELETSIADENIPAETKPALKTELETLKKEQDAIQKQSTNEGVLRTGQPEVGLQEVGKGNVQLEVTTTGTEEVTPEIKKKEVSDILKNIGEVDIDNYKLDLGEGLSLEVPKINQGVKPASNFQIKKDGKSLGSINIANAKGFYDRFDISKGINENDVIVDSGMTKGVEIFNENNKRKGYGTKAYIGLLKILDSELIGNLKGGRLLSSPQWSQSIDSYKLWESLYKKGLAKIIGTTAEGVENIKDLTSDSDKEYLKMNGNKRQIFIGEDLGMAYEGKPNGLIYNGNIYALDSKLIKEISEASLKIEPIISESELPGYDRMIQQVDGIIEKSKQRAVPNEKVKENVMDYVVKSSVYEKATDVQREKLFREVNKMFGVKEKSAPLAENILGNIKDVTKITMTEKQGLIKQIRDLARGGKDAKKAIYLAAQQLSKEMKELRRQGKLTTTQAANVLRKFSKVNVLSKTSVDRFTEYMTKVFEKADYIAKLATAKKLKQNISKLSKNKDKNAHLRELGRQFSEIDPSMVDNIEEYNEIAAKVKESIQGSTIKNVKEKGDFAEIVNIGETSSYIKDVMDAQNEKIREERIAEIQDLMGIDASKFSAEEMLDLLKGDEKVEVNDKKAIKETAKNAFRVYASIIRNMINTGIDSFTGEEVEFTKKQKELVSSFIDMDLNLLDAKESVAAVDALTNFLQNNSTAKMEDVVSQYTGELNIRKLVKEGKLGIALRKYWSKPLARLLTEGGTTLPEVFTKIFKGARAGLNIATASGFNKIVRGNARANTKIQDITKEYIGKFFKTKPNGEKFNTAYNDSERGIVSDLMRSVIGTESQMQKEFERRKRILNQSIKELSTGTKEQQKKGKLYQKVYDNVVKGSENAKDIEKKVDKTNLEAINFWMKTNEDTFPELYEYMLNVRNTMLEKDLNYSSPDRYVKLDQEKNKRLTEDEPMPMQGRNEELLVKKEAGGLMKAEHPDNLPKGMYRDYSFDKNNVNSLHESLVDMYTGAAIRQLDAFKSSDYFDKLIPTAEDRNLLRRRFALYVSNIRNSRNYGGEDLTALMKILDKVATLGVGMVLGSPSQVIKQTFPMGLNTMVNASGLLSGVMFNPAFNNFYHNSGYASANRGVESQAEISSLNKKIETATNEVELLKAIEDANKWWLRTFLVKPDVFIARVSWQTYYEQELRALGKDTKNLDYSKEKLNEDAADYAEMMVSRQQNVSDQALAGSWFTKNTPERRMLTKVFLNMASFRMNSSSRLAADLSVLGHSSVSTAEDKAIAARSIAGYAAEQAFYRIISTGLIIGLGSLALSMRDDDESEADKKKRINSVIKGQLTGAVIDVFSPAPPVDPLVKEILSPTLGALEEATGLPLSIYGTNRQDYTNTLGAYGIPFQRAGELYDVIKLGTTGKYKDEYGKEKQISEEDQQIISTLIPFSAGTLFGVMPSEVATITRDMVKFSKKKSTSDEEAAQKIENAEKKKESISEKVDALESIKEDASSNGELDAIDEKIDELEATTEEKKVIAEENKAERELKKELLTDPNTGKEYDNESDLKRYKPSIYEENFGEDSDWYKEHQDEKEIEKKLREELRRQKDEEEGYVPVSKRRKNSDGTFKRSTFGPQKSSGKSKSEYKFGPQSGTKKSEYKFGPQ